MGMGFAANWAYVIEDKDLKKVGQCGDLLNGLNKALADAGSEIDSLAQAIQSNGFDVAVAVDELTQGSNEKTTILHFYNELCKEFKKQTKMEIGLEYHSQSDEGDRYDDVDGGFWSVSGYYEVSKAGKEAQKKFKIKVQTKSFVCMG